MQDQCKNLTLKFEGNKFIATTEPRISGGKEVIVTVIWEKV